MKLLLNILLISVGSTALAQNIVLQNESSSLNDEIYYFADSSKSLQIEEIRTRYESGEFVGTSQKEPLLKDGAIWIHFFVFNPDQANDEWIISFQSWAFVDVFMEHNEIRTARKTGNLLPYRERDYPFAENNYTLFKLPKGDSIEFFVRFEYVFNNEKDPSSIGLTITNRRIVDEQNLKIERVMLVIMAILIVMLVYNFFIFAITRIKSSFYYLIVIVFTLLTILYNSGFAAQLLGAYDSSPYFLRTVIHITNSLYACAVLLFANSFLRIYERYPFWYKVIQFIWLAFAVEILIVLVDVEFGFKITSLTGFVSAITTIILAIKSKIDKFPSAGYFLFGYSVLLISLMVVILAAFKVLPMNIWTFTLALPMGSTIEVVTFSLALANLINRLRHENELKQHQIIDQLRANQDLQNKVTRELEEKVQERTSEINIQKEMITEQKIAIEVEQEKSEKLLLNILPKGIARELKDKGYSEPKLYNNVSVIFADIVGFTQITGEYTPSELVQELDYWFAGFDEIISRHSIEKIKTIGDAYMAVSGIPDQDDSATVAIMVAIEFLEFVRKRNAEKVKMEKAPWEIRIGIHTGPVTAGVVGKKKFVFDIWGDTVNVAAAAEANGIAGKINISSSTYEEVRDKYECEYRGEVEMKNKRKLDMYFVNY